MEKPLNAFDRSEVSSDENFLFMNQIMNPFWVFRVHSEFNLFTIHRSPSFFYSSSQSLFHPAFELLSCPALSLPSHCCRHLLLPCENRKQLRSFPPSHSSTSVTIAMHACCSLRCLHESKSASFESERNY